MAGAIEEVKGKEATRVAYGKTLAALGKENPNIVVLDADLSGSTQTKFFAKEFPDRFFNMGIAEQNMLGVAAGLARAGKIPFASSFAMFAVGRAWEQLRNAIGHNYVNVKVCATHAGLTVGEDGGSHQIIEDIAITRAIPHMTVIVPADATEAEKVIRAVAEFEGPVYVRLARAKTEILFDDNYKFEIGKGNLLKEGNDVTIVSCGVMVERALKAAELLKEKGVDAEVINMASVKPIDADMIARSAKKTGKVVTAEEHNIHGGLGDAVAAVLGEHAPCPLKRVGVQDEFGQSGTGDELLEYYGLTAEKIAEAAFSMA